MHAVVLATTFTYLVVRACPHIATNNNDGDDDDEDDDGDDLSPLKNL